MKSFMTNLILFNISHFQICHLFYLNITKGECIVLIYWVFWFEDWLMATCQTTRWLLSDLAKDAPSSTTSAGVSLSVSPTKDNIVNNLPRKLVHSKVNVCYWIGALSCCFILWLAFCLSFDCFEPIQIILNEKMSKKLEHKKITRKTTATKPII